VNYTVSMSATAGGRGQPGACARAPVAASVPTAPHPLAARGKPLADRCRLWGRRRLRDWRTWAGLEGAGLTQFCAATVRVRREVRDGTALPQAEGGVRRHCRTYAPSAYPAKSGGGCPHGRVARVQHGHGERATMRDAHVAVRLPLQVSVGVGAPVGGSCLLLTPGGRGGRAIVTSNPVLGSVVVFRRSHTETVFVQGALDITLPSCAGIPCPTFLSSRMDAADLLV